MMMMMMMMMKYTVKFAGHLIDDGINAITRKALRRGVTHTAFDMAEMIIKYDRKLFTYHPSWSLFISSPSSRNICTLLI